MTWDLYGAAGLHLDLPDGGLEVTPVAFFRTDGTFPGDGRPWHIITARYAGLSRHAADGGSDTLSRLLDRVAASGLTHHLARTIEPGGSYGQQAVAVLGMDREQARALGRELGQDAIVEWSATLLTVVSCTEDRFHYTGWAVSPASAPPEASPAAPAPMTARAWAAPVSGEALEAEFARLLADEEYFAGLASRTGILFTVERDEADGTEIVVSGAGRGAEVFEGDWPVQRVANIADDLGPVVLALMPEGDGEFRSGQWGPGDIAYVLGPAFDHLFIDGVEWHDEAWSGTPGRVVRLPARLDTPASCRVKGMSWELDEGSGTVVASESGSAELIQVGPVYVARGDGWAHVVAADDRGAAIRRFHDDGCEAAKRQQQEGHERSPLLGPPRPA